MTITNQYARGIKLINEIAQLRAEAKEVDKKINITLKSDTDEAQREFDKLSDLECKLNDKVSKKISQLALWAEFGKI